MADILPEPVNDDVLYGQTATPSRATRQKRRTFGVLVALVVIAAICLVVAVFYNMVHNNNLDKTRKQDLVYISTQLEGYYDANKFYPTLVQLNSDTFSVFNPTLNRSYFHDPSATSRLLTATPSDSSYAYEVIPSNCDNIKTTCNSYKLVAILSSNQQYTVKSKH